MAKANPYLKYLGPEDHMQKAVLNYLRTAYPNALYTHPPNEGKRSPFERFKFKYLGSSSGVPDILIFSPSKQYNGLAIELKVGYNKPTKSQMHWLDNLKLCNWHSICINNFDDCIKLIDNYFKNNL